MAFMIDLPPPMVDEAKGCATRLGTTVEQLLFDSLKRELDRQRKAQHQLDVIDEIAGLWEDDRTTDEIIADIEGSRTMGREVEL